MYTHPMFTRRMWTRHTQEVKEHQHRNFNSKIRTEEISRDQTRFSHFDGRAQDPNDHLPS
jgi:hypothetical protein